MRQEKHLNRIVACAGVILSLTLMADVYGSSGPAQSGLFAKADSAMTAALNPAGLTRLEGPDWVAQGVFFVSESEFEQTADSADGEMTVDSDGFLVAPLIYYGRPISEKWSAGFSATVLGFGEDVGEGPTRYLVSEWAMVMASVSPALAWRVSEKVSLGAALNINYTYYYYESAVLNPEPDIGDGRMEIEATDISFSGQFGLLWELTPRTRIGFNYKSEVESEFADTPEFSGLGPIRQTLLEQGGVLTNELVFQTMTPQSLGGGIYHELSSGTSVTFDAVWIEFSEFGISEFSVRDSGVEVNNQDFEDVWAFSFGVSYPLHNRWSLKAGFMGTTQFIDDVNRTKTLKMDQIFGIGLGAEYQWGDKRIIGLNLNYYDLGDAPVTVDIPLVGTVRGQYSEHYSIGLDFTFRWIR
jgi:long-chain fatty acid transport protein